MSLLHVIKHSQWIDQLMNLDEKQTSTAIPYSPTLPGHLPTTTTRKSPTRTPYAPTLPGSLPTTTTRKAPTPTPYNPILPGSLPTITIRKSTMALTATWVKGNGNSTSGRSAETKEDSDWIILLIIVSVVIVVIAVFAFIFSFKRRRGSLEHRQQGCYFSIKNAEQKARSDNGDAIPTADHCTESSWTIDNDFAYVKSESKNKTYSVETFV